MGKSSIHVNPVKGGSEQHNQRTKELNYVRKDLAYLNSSFVKQSIADAKAFTNRNYQEKVGQKMQPRATPIREGVLLISENHTATDLRRLGDKIEQEFGIKTIQGYCHKDEGHYDKQTEEWKPNHHAHMVFDWTDHETGKSIKMGREDMSKLQTLVANELGLERGVNSSVKHLNSVQYKQVQVEKDLAMTHGLEKAIPEAMNMQKKLKLDQARQKANSRVIDDQIDEKRQKHEQVKTELQKVQIELQKVELELRKMNQIKKDKGMRL